MLYVSQLTEALSQTEHKQTTTELCLQTLVYSVRHRLDLKCAHAVLLQKSLVQKMERTTCELGAMSELQQYQLQNTTTSSQAAFEACDITTFCELLSITQ